MATRHSLILTSTTPEVLAGSIMAYVGTFESLQNLSGQGWLLCDGGEYPPNQYPELFQAIGTAFGGDGADSFFVPDLRGQFLRGVDMSKGVDPDVATRTAQNPNANSGASVGSVQASALKIHSHTWSQNFGQITSDGSDLNVQLALNSPNGNNLGAPQTTTDENGDSTESRPTNVYVYYIICTGVIPS